MKKMRGEPKPKIAHEYDVIAHDLEDGTFDVGKNRFGRPGIVTAAEFNTYVAVAEGSVLVWRDWFGPRDAQRVGAAVGAAIGAFGMAAVLWGAYRALKHFGLDSDRYTFWFWEVVGMSVVFLPFGMWIRRATTEKLERDFGG